MYEQANFSSASCYAWREISERLIPPYWEHTSEKQGTKHSAGLLCFLSASPGIFVINGYAEFIFTPDLPCYQSDIFNCKASMVSLFTMENKSLSSKQAVPAAFVFLGTCFFFFSQQWGNLCWVLSTAEKTMNQTEPNAVFSLSPFSHIASPLLYSSVSKIFWWNETVMFNRLTARINQKKVAYLRYNHIERVYEVLGRTSPQQKRRVSKKPLCINPWQVEDSKGVTPEPRDCQLFSWRPTLFYLCFPSPFSNVNPGSRNSPKESGFTIWKMNDTFPSS